MATRPPGGNRACSFKMASSGKKGRKVKGKTLGLNEFLADEVNAPQAGYAATTAKKVDWAAEMENETLDDKYTLDGAFGGSGGTKSVFVLPTAPRASREPLADMSKVPSKPPFTAFVANLPYDLDPEDLSRFFCKLNLKGVRLPKEENGRMKGYGYAEFGDRESLIEALGMSDTTLKNRNVRISPADQNQENESRDESADRTIGDWRSASRDDGPARDDGFRSRERGSDSFPERFEKERFSQDRDRGFGGDRDRDRGRERYGRGFERSGGGFERSGGGGRMGEDFDRGGGAPPERGNFNDRMGESREIERDYDGSRGFDRGGRSNRRDFGSDFRGGDRYSGGRGFDDYDGGRGGSRNNDRYEKGGSAAYERDDKKDGGPKERPRLQLKPRSVQVDAAASSSSISKIFGAAKPVDTAAREREIAERIDRERDGKLARREPEQAEREPLKWDRTDRKSESSESESRESVRSGPEERSVSRRRGSVEIIQKNVDSSEPAPLRTQDGSERGSERGSQSEPEDERFDRNSLPPPAGKPPSPRKEDSKAIPAPPPKENIWQKRASAGSEKENDQYNTVPRTKRSSSIGSNSSDQESGRRTVHDRPPAGRRQESENYNSSRRREDSRGRRRDDYPPPRDDSASRRRNERSGDNRGGNRGSGGRNRGERTFTRRDGSDHSRERERSQEKDKPREKTSSKDVKYEEPKPPVYASQNKFCLLNEDEDAQPGYGSN